MAKISALLAVCILLAVVNVNAISRTEVTSFLKLLSPIAQVCMAEVGATRDDFDEFIRLQPPNSRSGKCLRACLAQKIAVVDRRGRLVKSAAMNIASTALFLTMKDNRRVRSQLRLVEKVVNICASRPAPMDLCDSISDILVCLHDQGVLHGILV